MIDNVYRAADMRDLLVDAYVDIDKDKARMVDILGASFIADETTIFGAVNEDYVNRELEWYLGQSLNVNDIPGGPPAIWKQVADNVGLINSNYGFLLFSTANGMQYTNVVSELGANPDSRRAVAIYTRPSMHYDATAFGMSDFVCTNAVHYRIERGHLHAIVQMRSNDAVFGYRNDYAWQRWVLNKLANELGVPAGQIIWQAASFHVYPRHFHLLDTYIETGEWNGSVTKAAA